jgi:hypothetical protein
MNLYVVLSIYMLSIYSSRVFLLIFGWLLHLCCKVWVICSLNFSLMRLLLWWWKLTYTSLIETRDGPIQHFIYTGLMKQADKWENQQTEFDTLSSCTHINCYLQLGLWKDFYTYRDTYHSDMEEVCLERTKLAHIQDLSTSGHTPQVRNNYSYQSTITEISKSRKLESVNYFVDRNYNFLDLTSKWDSS